MWQEMKESGGEGWSGFHNSTERQAIKWPMDMQEVLSSESYHLPAAQSGDRAFNTPHHSRVAKIKMIASCEHWIRNGVRKCWL